MLESACDLYVCFTWRRQDRLSEPSPNDKASACTFPCYTKYFDNAPLWCAAQNSTRTPVTVPALCPAGKSRMCCAHVRRTFAMGAARVAPRV